MNSGSPTSPGGGVYGAGGAGACPRLRAAISNSHDCRGAGHGGFTRPHSQEETRELTREQRDVVQRVHEVERKVLGLITQRLGNDNPLLAELRNEMRRAVSLPASSRSPCNSADCFFLCFGAQRQSVKRRPFELMVDTMFEQYKRLRGWVCNALDVYKPELLELLFPLFAHTYVLLMSHKAEHHHVKVEPRTLFFERFREDFEGCRPGDLAELAAISSPGAAPASALVKKLKQQQWDVAVSEYAYELFLACMHRNGLFTMLDLTMEHVAVRVVRKAPASDAAMTRESSGVSASLDTVAGGDEFSARRRQIMWGTLLEALPVVPAGPSPEPASNHGADADTAHDTGAAASIGAVKRKRDDDDASAGEVPSAGGKPDEVSESPAARIRGGGIADRLEARSSLLHKRPQDKVPRRETFALPTHGDSGPLLLDGVASDEDIKAFREREALTRSLLLRLASREAAISEDTRRQCAEDVVKRRSLRLDGSLSALCFTVLNEHESMTCMRVSADGSVAAAGFSDSSARVWRLDGAPMGTVYGTPAVGTAASSHSSPGSGGGGSASVTARSKWGSATSSDSADGPAPDASCCHLVGHSGEVYSIDVSEDLTMVVTGSADSTVRLWSLEAGAPITEHRGHSGAVWDVRFGPRDVTFISASRDGTAILWEPHTASPVRTLVGHVGDVEAAVVHPNSCYAATASADATVRVWDLGDGKCVRVLTGHKTAVNAVAVSPDGGFVAGGSDAGDVLVWRIEGGAPVAHLTCPSTQSPVSVSTQQPRVWSVSFSRDGALIAAARGDCVVGVWDMDVALGRRAPRSEGAAALATAGDEPVRAVTLHGEQRQGEEVGPCDALLSTLRTKNTPPLHVSFSRRNVLLAAGPFRL